MKIKKGLINRWKQEKLFLKYFDYTQVVLTEELCFVVFPESTCDVAPTDEELCNYSPVKYKVAVNILCPN